KAALTAMSVGSAAAAADQSSGSNAHVKARQAVTSRAPLQARQDLARDGIAGGIFDVARVQQVGPGYAQREVVGDVPGEAAAELGISGNPAVPEPADRAEVYVKIDRGTEVHARSQRNCVPRIDAVLRRADKRRGSPGLEVEIFAEQRGAGRYRPPRQGPGAPPSLYS